MSTNLVYRKKGTRVIIPWHTGIESNEAMVAMTVQEAQEQGLLSPSISPKRSTLEGELEELRVENNQLRKDLAGAIKEIATLKAQTEVPDQILPEPAVKVKAGKVPQEPTPEDTSEPESLVVDANAKQPVSAAPAEDDPLRPKGLDEILARANV